MGEKMLQNNIFKPMNVFHHYYNLWNLLLTSDSVESVFFFWWVKENALMVSGLAWSHAPLVNVH